MHGSEVFWPEVLHRCPGSDYIQRVVEEPWHLGKISSGWEKGKNSLGLICFICRPSASMNLPGVRLISTSF